MLPHVTRVSLLTALFVAMLGEPSHRLHSPLHSPIQQVGKGRQQWCLVHVTDRQVYMIGHPRGCRKVRKGQSCREPFSYPTSAWMQENAKFVQKNAQDCESSPP